MTGDQTVAVIWERVKIHRVLRAKDMIVIGTPGVARASFLYLLAISGLLTREAPRKDRLVQIYPLA